MRFSLRQHFYHITKVMGGPHWLGANNNIVFTIITQSFNIEAFDLH